MNRAEKKKKKEIYTVCICISHPKTGQTLGVCTRCVVWGIVDSPHSLGSMGEVLARSRPTRWVIVNMLSHSWFWSAEEQIWTLTAPPNSHKTGSGDLSKEKGPRSAHRALRLSCWIASKCECECECECSRCCNHNCCISTWLVLYIYLNWHLQLGYDQDVVIKRGIAMPWDEITLTPFVS